LEQHSVFVETWELSSIGGDGREERNVVERMFKNKWRYVVTLIGTVTVIKIGG
jgi:hypothetical protein